MMQSMTQDEYIKHLTDALAAANKRIEELEAREWAVEHMWPIAAPGEPQTPTSFPRRLEAAEDTPLPGAVGRNTGRPIYAPAVQPIADYINDLEREGTIDHAIAFDIRLRLAGIVVPAGEPQTLEQPVAWRTRLPDSSCTAWFDGKPPNHHGPYELAYAAPVSPSSEEMVEADKYFDMASEFGHQLQSICAVVQDAIDLLVERKYGNDARSPGHNARLILETALKKVTPGALSRPPRVCPDCGRPVDGPTHAAYCPMPSQEQKT